jgi:hypothetical protein
MRILYRGEPAATFGPNPMLPAWRTERGARCPGAGRRCGTSLVTWAQERDRTAGCELTDRQVLAEAKC